MAAPALAESRTACPACGGVIHPIAGRCKHCKVDLTRLRAGGGSNAPRPRLVALGGGGPAAAAPADAAAPAADPMAVPPPVPVYADASARVAAPSSGGWSRRWPLVVVIVAVVAILASLALLLFGGDGKKKHKTAKRIEGPAPEMNLDPHANTVPVPDPVPHGQVAPPTAPPPSIDPNAVPTPPLNPPPPPTATGPISSFPQFLEAAIDTGCKRLLACTGNDPSIAGQCTMARTQLGTLTSSMGAACTDFNSASAGRCIDSLATFPCPTGAADPAQMTQTLLGLQDCAAVCPSAFSMLGGGGLTNPADPLAP